MPDDKSKERQRESSICKTISVLAPSEGGSATALTQKPLGAGAIMALDRPQRSKLGLNGSRFRHNVRICHNIHYAIYEFPLACFHATASLRAPQPGSVAGPAVRCPAFGNGLLISIANPWTAISIARRFAAALPANPAHGPWPDFRGNDGSHRSRYGFVVLTLAARPVAAAFARIRR
jgi:hypothetical protein